VRVEFPTTGSSEHRSAQALSDRTRVTNARPIVLTMQLIESDIESADGMLVDGTVKTL
jgi:hypothetical protein